jgi:hypothetical protein
MTYRILITGSRDFEDYLTVHTAIRAAAAGHRDVTVIVGRAKGADRLAERAALDLGYAIDPHPAHWRTFGKAAGARRNQEMVDTGADVCLAFWQHGAANAGTTDCVRRARAARIPIRSSYGW